MKVVEAGLGPGGDILGAGKGPHGYVVMAASEELTAKIRNDGKELLQRLAAYNSLFKPGAMPMHH